jgi:hypothetical protein
MKHAYSLVARTLGAALLVAGAGACSESDHWYDLGGGALAPNPPSPSAVVIGVAPGEPSVPPDSAGTPVGETKTELTAAVDSQAMPLPGQANDHSNVAREPSQKSGNEGALQSVEKAKAANDGEGAK